MEAPLTLAVGQRLGRFEVLSSLGAGGMGEVYRARDLKLGREVALKVLPEAVSGSAERRARFSREAKLLATLNHPAIASLYEVHEEANRDVLVMELVEGETLADRLGRGALPIRQALEVARQVGEALEGAHDRGILHRDLKPANIMLTPAGAVKLLDFGLATVLDAPVQPEADTVTRSPKLDDTSPGLALGTAPYMSPEQARGEELDKRTDVWAFGCVLYEVLTGRRAFSGPTRTDVMAAVLEKEPDWAKVPAAAPIKVQDLLHRCLQKERSRRLRDIGDARLELQEALEESEVGRSGPRRAAPARSVRGRWIVGVAMLASVGGLAFWVWRTLPRAVPLPNRISLTVPAGVDVSRGNTYQVLGLSPDGTSVVYQASVDGKRQVFIQGLDETAPRSSIDDARNPFFSPDGRWLGFLQGGELRKMAVAGGTATPICKLNEARGLAWGLDDRILFTPNSSSGLWSVTAAGGKPEELTTLDPTSKFISHRWPQALPDGNHVLFTLFPASQLEDDAKLAVLSLDTRQWKVVLEGSQLGRYLPSGHLVYRHLGSLRAVAFDLGRLEVVGPRVEALSNVLMDTAGTGQTFVSTSASGMLAYVPGFPKAVPRSLLWVDRSGRATPVTGRRLAYYSAALSPDGRKIAAEVEDVETSHMELLDVARDTWVSPTPGLRSAASPVFSPDGRWIALSGLLGSEGGIFRVPTDGSGPPELITSWRGPLFPGGWSPDGKTLIYAAPDPESFWDLWTVPLEGDPKPRAFLKTPGAQTSPSFSQDGRYVAYFSNGEVAIIPFPGPGASRQVSSGGGVHARWSRDGKELFYRSRGKPPKMMSVRVSTHPALTLEAPRALFDDVFFPAAYINMTSYDVTADGLRFLMIEQPEEPEPPRQIVVIPGFADEVKEKLRAAAK